MKEIQHPSAFIDPALSTIISGRAEKAEKSGSLHPNQLAVIDAQRWFNLFVPIEYNGLGLSLLDGLKIEEGLAWADGSTGWTVTLCSGANWFIGFLAPELRESIFKNDKVCLAGSGHPSGIAKMTAAGYEITGIWKYASGAPDATAFTANCRVEKDGAQLQNEDGSAMIRSFLFLRSEVTVIEDWDSVGMIATASHSFAVKDLSVAGNRCFIIEPHHARLDQHIYQFPFLQFAETTLAVNSSGMAFRFLDLCEQLLKPKTTSNYAEEAKTILQASRQVFYSTVIEAWEECVLKRTITPELLDRVSKTSHELAATARRLVDELYPYCGMAAARRDTEINRVWRNLHTASQHSLLLSMPVFE